MPINPSQNLQNKILVVDDDPAIRNLVFRFLSFNDYQVETAEDAKTARHLFKEFNPDLVILDVNLPDDSGFNLCKEMRNPQTIVLMLTSLSDTNYVLEGFEKGADDYLTKPFNLEVLKAKIGALIKRQSAMEIPPSIPETPINFGRLEFHLERNEVVIENESVSLTQLEFELLYFLVTHPGQIWGRMELISAVWGSVDDVKAERKVDVHIGQIRRKIGEPEGNYIQTIRGKGYIFEIPRPKKAPL
jgi:DNA-binding response OmpR family regulator